MRSHLLGAEFFLATDTHRWGEDAKIFTNQPYRRDANEESGGGYRRWLARFYIRYFSLRIRELKIRGLRRRALVVSEIACYAMFLARVA